MGKMIKLFQGLIDFLIILYRRRGMIMDMAQRDVASHHIGSLLGFFWTFVNPIIMITILWFVFSVGFGTMPKGNIPFVVWLTSGMCIWNTFVEAVVSSTNSIVSNPHLVKRVVFPLSILPVVKLVGSFFSHAIFLVLLMFLIFLNGMPFSLFWLQAFYYLGAMSLLALGVGWITASINVFVRDTAQIVGVAMQIGFWGTPIFWDLSLMPEQYQFFIKLNPVYYLVQGYRESFIYGIPFWQHSEMTIYFWGVTGIVFVFGAIIFQQLRPHFPDVL
jgi:lipopolysaccharide transport system permease protein/teichoic acid transport system permease protein